MELAELARERHALIDHVKLHGQSVAYFRPEERCWFALNLAERDDPPPEREDGRPHHLSTTASCFESLADERPAEQGLGESYRLMAEDFARHALRAPATAWRSEGAAEVYCRVRALPGVIRFADTLDGDLGQAARNLLLDAWSTVELAKPDSGGIAERELFNSKGERVEGPQDTRAPGYPPNAFLTYWGLRALDAYETRRTSAGPLEELPSEVFDRKRLALAWSSHTLARQTALILGDAEHTDPQQLAYALAADLNRVEERLTAGNARHELAHAALAAFFKAQLPSGAWPRGEPLFHYPESGNAYCFTYETLTELLRPALPREGGRVFRELLREHLPKLIRAWHHAVETQVPLDSDGSAVGWSSGHHVFRQQPEGWATAAVFTYAQMLRCVIGHFTVDAASQQVRIRRPRQSDPVEARKTLKQRGNTWATDGWTVGRQLAGMFLHPRLNESSDPKTCDPDTPLIATDDARSAILFGPPGTGKTTLVESLAGALGWRFVEVLAADFLSQGVDAVPARADEIFGALMELDRCVVLFDEIDELIRRREGQETDPFGRFLTTSMLPKIAQLWEQRKVLFFVATNHVAKADTAIRRSSRFDAAILVAPPSLAVKQDELERQLDAGAPTLPADKVRKALLPRQDQGDLAPAQLPYGVVALLRYDQINELGDRLTAAATNNGKTGDSALLEALSAMGEDLLHNEWRPEDDNLPETSEDRLHKLFDVLRAYQAEERQDRSRRRYLVVADAAAETPAGTKLVGPTAEGQLCQVTVETVAAMASNGASDGLEAKTASGDTLRDDGLLIFRKA